MSSDTSIDERPPLSDAHQSILDKVLAARRTDAIEVEREYEGVPVVFQFQPSMSLPALQIVAKVQRMSRQRDADVMEQLDSLMDFMDAMAFPDTANLIAAMIAAGAITVNDIADLQQEVVTRVAARPTMRSSSSDDGSATSSTSSMPPPPPTPE
jgi:hypothetical protein